MRQFIRQGFILLLLVLQGVAPLLHAHARAADIAVGLHLPELEVLSAPRADPAMQTTAWYAPVCDGAWVSVAMGLVSSPTGESPRALLFLQDTPAITGMISSYRLLPEFPARCLSFLITSFLPPTRLYRAAAPRAPPVCRWS